MKKIVFLLLFVVAVFSMTSFCMQQHEEHLLDFVYERDIEDVLKLFYDDWHQLFTKVNPYYDRKLVLQDEIPNKNVIAEYPGRKLQMKVLRNHQQVIGFVTFYKENSDLGRVRIISIAQDFREKGCDRKLIIAAVKNLFDSGCTRAYLYTHKKNEKVSTYENLGFTEDEMPESAIAWYKENGISAEEYAEYAHYSVTIETFKAPVHRS